MNKLTESPILPFAANLDLMSATRLLCSSFISAVFRSCSSHFIAKRRRHTPEMRKKKWKRRQCHRSILRADELCMIMIHLVDKAIYQRKKVDVNRFIDRLFALCTTISTIQFLKQELMRFHFHRHVAFHRPIQTIEDNLCCWHAKCACTFFYEGRLRISVLFNNNSTDVIVGFVLLRFGKLQFFPPTLGLLMAHATGIVCPIFRSATYRKIIR